MCVKNMMLAAAYVSLPAHTTSASTWVYPGWEARQCSCMIPRLLYPGRVRGDDSILHRYSASLNLKLENLGLVGSSSNPVLMTAYCIILQLDPKHTACCRLSCSLSLKSASSTRTWGKTVIFFLHLCFGQCSTEEGVKTISKDCEKHGNMD